MQLSEEEKHQIETQRKREELKVNVLTQIDKLLKENNFSLIVNPNSPVGNPNIIIVENT